MSLYINTSRLSLKSSKVGIILRRQKKSAAKRILFDYSEVGSIISIPSPENSDYSRSDRPSIGKKQ